VTRITSLAGSHSLSDLDTPVTALRVQANPAPSLHPSTAANYFNAFTGSPPIRVSARLTGVKCT